MPSYRNKSAQAAMEYLMMMGLITIIIIPTTFLFYSYASESAEDIDKAQIDKFARDLITTAETVYYLGYPSRIVIKERLPNTVESISVVQDPVSGIYLLIVDVRTQDGISTQSYPTAVNILGVFGEETITAGIKTIRVEAGPVIGGSAVVTVNIGEDPTCDDATIHNTCSSTQPQYCFNSVLLNNCQECGCAGTLLCKADGSCLIPTITSIDPSSGIFSGGTTVTITGDEFIDTPTVEFGSFFGSVTFVSSNKLSVVTPPGSLGAVDVIVTNPDGGNDILSDGFTYTPPPTVSSIVPSNGSAVGNTSVTINGSNFAATPTVAFDDVAATSIVFVNNNTITAVTPAGNGTIDVMVTNPDGGSDTLIAGFTYNPPPTINSLNPTMGLPSGGTTITITGSDFVDDLGFGVTFDSNAATVNFVTPTIVEVVTPAGSVGSVSIVVTNPDSQSDNNTFTYTNCLDFDGDGYGNPGHVDCPNGAASDCNDNDAAINPGAAEICNDVDDNCVSGIDEACDDDGDDYCDANMALVGTPAVCPNGGGDCDDNDVTLWQLLTGYLDADVDGFFSEVGESVCSGESLPSVYSSSAGSDCYDFNNNAKPGQTKYFGVSRGDGSFDYNCDSVETKRDNCLANIITSSCTTNVAGTHPGYVDSIPACGSSGSHARCTRYTSNDCSGSLGTKRSCSDSCAAGLSYLGLPGTRIQACR